MDNSDIIVARRDALHERFAKWFKRLANDPHALETLRSKDFNADAWATHLMEHLTYSGDGRIHTLPLQR